MSDSLLSLRLHNRNDENGSLEEEQLNAIGDDCTIDDDIQETLDTMVRQVYF